MPDKTAVLFLDIDGVLCLQRAHEGRTHEVPDPRAAANLQELCEKTGAKIVINSDWLAYRSENDIADLQKLIADAGLTAYLHEDWQTGYAPMARDREAAIGAWLAGHQDIAEYLIIDDANLPGLTAEQARRHVHTALYNGFTDEDLEFSLRLLHRPAQARDFGEETVREVERRAAAFQGFYDAMAQFDEASLKANRLLGPVLDEAERLGDATQARAIKSFFQAQCHAFGPLHAIAGHH